MRARTLIAGLGLVIGSSDLEAQLPQIPAIPANSPGSPASMIPGMSGPGNAPGQPISPGFPNSIPGMSGPGNALGQPISPLNSPNTSPFPVQPAGNFPGSFPAGSPLLPQNLGTAMPAFRPGQMQLPQNPSLLPQGNFQQPMQPLIANGSPQGQSNPIAQPQEITLPLPENKILLRSGDVSLKRLNTGWQLWLGQRVLRDFGDREMDARNALRVYQDLRPTEWIIIGTGKPIVEYGLVNGRSQLTADASAENDQHGNTLPIVPVNDNQPFPTGAGARQITPIDLRTVRIEAIRGVWCLRDNYNLHINFGLDKADADQALAVLRKYGFNRVGVVGTPNPVMTYFFANPDTSAPMPKGPLVLANLQSQIENLSKVGVPVAGVGYVGEMVRIDSQKLVVRKDGGEWLVQSGTEVLGRFGSNEWVAHDAARSIQNAHFTEFCKLGSAGLTFFLTDGRAPTHVPLDVQGRVFDLNALKVRKNADRWAVTENGRLLFECASQEEGDILVRFLQSYQFDQLCHIGPGPKQGISFMAKSR